MTWFKVDDRFHSHPKALATSLAALGLWTVAGSWSSDHRQGGAVPDHVLPSLSRGASELADELVAAGLWRRVRGGYQFHDWDDKNPTKEEAIAQSDKRSSGGSLGNHRRWHVDRGVTSPDCPYCQDKRESPVHRSSDRGSESGPSPPVPVPSPNNSYVKSSNYLQGPVDNSDDDDVPATVWDRYAQLKLERQPSGKVSNPDSYKRTTVENAKSEQGETALRWWREFDVRPHELAEWLIDGRPSRHAQRRQEPTQ